MSRSNNTEIKNPANKFFEWDGANGGVTYYDKTEEDPQKRNKTVALPFTFLTLDTLHKIGGYSKADKSGYWSNEIRDTKKDILNVRMKKGLVEEGLYNDIIKSRTITGAKYCQSVYIAYKDGKELVVGNLTLSGASLSAWIEFRKTNDVYKGAVTITGFTEGESGITKFQIPSFKLLACSEETEAKAIELDKNLQEYLTAYLSKSGSSTERVTHSKPDQEESPTNDAPIHPGHNLYTGGQAVPPAQRSSAAPVSLDDDDLPF